MVTIYLYWDRSGNNNLSISIEIDSTCLVILGRQQPWLRCQSFFMIWKIQCWWVGHCTRGSRSLELSLPAVSKGSWNEQANLESIINDTCLIIIIKWPRIHPCPKSVVRRCSQMVYRWSADSEYTNDNVNQIERLITYWFGTQCMAPKAY